MDTAEIELTTPDGPMPIYQVTPDGAPRGAVVIVQEAFGVNDHIKDVTRRAAEAGYLAAAPTLFHRAGGGVVPYDDFTKVRELFKGLTDDGILTDVDTTLEHLHQAGFADEQIGIVGWCFGGRVAFLVAAHRELGAAVTFYGGGIVAPNPLSPTALMDQVEGVQTPWLGLFGDEDTGIPVDGVEELRVRLQKTPVATDIVRYPDAGHGFHCDARPAYDEDAARHAWSRSLDWFTQHLGA